MDSGIPLQRTGDRDSDLFATGVTMAVLATTAVGLRMGCKRHLKYPVSADDYLIFLSLVRSCQQKATRCLAQLLILRPDPGIRPLCNVDSLSVSPNGNRIITLS